MKHIKNKDVSVNTFVLYFVTLLAQTKKHRYSTNYSWIPIKTTVREMDSGHLKEDGRLLTIKELSWRLWLLATNSGGHFIGSPIGVWLDCQEFN